MSLGGHNRVRLQGELMFSGPESGLPILPSTLDNHGEVPPEATRPRRSTSTGAFLIHARSAQVTPDWRPLVFLHGVWSGDHAMWIVLLVAAVALPGLAWLLFEILNP
jgi:hypothetical protein